MNEAEIAAGMAPTPGYRYAELVGDELFVAGQVPLDGAGELVGRGHAAAQTLQCVANLRVLIGVHGFTDRHIRRLTIHVVGEHQNLLDAWDAVRSSFGDDVPPATLLGAPLLGYTDQLVEIDATVIR